MRDPDTKHEYDKSIELYKHYSTVQFARLSVFVAVMSAGIVYLLGDKSPSEPALSIGNIAMIIVTGLFWIMQESDMYIVGHFLRRSAQLEITLGYCGFSKMPGMPKYKYAPSKWALRAFYFVLLCFWSTVSIHALYKIV